MPKVTPIMGPGCGNPDLEHCPPSYHVELTTAEVHELMRDPENAAKRMGLGSDIKSVLIDLPEKATTHSVDEKATTDSFDATYCCQKCLSNSLC